MWRVVVCGIRLCELSSGIDMVGRSSVGVECFRTEQSYLERNVEATYRLHRQRLFRQLKEGFMASFMDKAVDQLEEMVGRLRTRML